MKIAPFTSFQNQAYDEILRILSALPDVEILSADSPISCADVALSVGGDGTFLRTANKVGDTGVPILGVNAGHLGFLADVPLDQASSLLPAILGGQYVLEKRSLLDLFIPECKQPYQRYSLNEVAILKRDVSSMVSVAVSVDGNYLNQYDADGLVIATPTGSTAYAMSSGGPILEPQSDCFVIVPIAPHTLTTRPLVIRDSCELTIEVKSRNGLFLVATDGNPLHLTTQYKLKLSKAAHKINVMRRSDHTFYDTLRQKLMWGCDPRETR